MKKTLIAAFFSFAGFSAAAASLDSLISSYEKSSKVRQTTRELRNNKLARSKGLCAKYVRLGYMASGLIPSHPGISYAKNYKGYFDQNNWTDLFNGSSWMSKVRSDLFKTPNGCAVVYDALNPVNDRNGHIGHIETRLKEGGSGSWGFISDYYSANPRTGLECTKKGAKKRRRIEFNSRKESAYKGKRAKIYIEYTPCLANSNKGAIISDELKNRKVIGVHCKL
jgi:hypothetical protein